MVSNSTNVRLENLEKRSMNSATVKGISIRKETFKPGKPLSSNHTKR